LRPRRLRLAALTVMCRCIVTVAAVLTVSQCTTILPSQASTRGTIIASTRMQATTRCIGIIDHTLTPGISQDIDFTVLTSRDFTGLLRSQHIGRFSDPLCLRRIGHFTDHLRSRRTGHFFQAMRTGVHVSALAEPAAAKPL
jgi:hypothetical protein